jgi:hypothetical protein
MCAGCALSGSVVLLAPACARACGPVLGAPAAATGPPWFEEQATERGLVFEHRSGHEGRHWMPEIMGGGGALLDADGDGDLDAYLVQGGSLAPGAAAARHHLFLNDGAGVFADAGAAGGAALDGTGPGGTGSGGAARYGMGVACGDADGDGDTDLYVTHVGPNVLLENTGGGFREASDAGAEGGGWSTSAAFFDGDRDGALDLFVARYLEWSRTAELSCSDPLGRPDYCSPKNYRTPARSLLFRNAGAGRFEDVSRASGVSTAAGNGLGVVCGDLDRDGWQDVLVANDGTPNHLWRNLADGRFEEQGMLAGCGMDSNGIAKAGMGVVLCDLDEDLDLDVLVCNLAGESDSFFQNEGGYFGDRTGALGLGTVSKPFTRFGLALADFDQDGWLDLYQANGRVERRRVPQAGDPYAEPNLLLRGTSTGRFEEVLPRGGTSRELGGTSRAVAQGDVDGDGALDLLVVNRDGPARLLLNRASGRGRALTLRVLERSGADALGAELVIDVGPRRLRRDVAAAFGYLSSHDPRVHLGLGAAEQIDGVLVRWVDGTAERFGPLDAGGVHELRRGRGTRP